MGTMVSQVLAKVQPRPEELSPRTIVRWGSLFTMFVLLNLADLELTQRLFGEVGSAAKELNPLANSLLSTYGWTGVIGLKLATTAAVGLLLAFVFACRPRLGH